jgi:hypothetical protein
MRGAVLFGLKPRIVSSRIVKKTYGIAVSCEWNPKKHGVRAPRLTPPPTRQ